MGFRGIITTAEQVLIVRPFPSTCILAPAGGTTPSELFLHSFEESGLAIARITRKEDGFWPVLDDTWQQRIIQGCFNIGIAHKVTVQAPVVGIADLTIAIESAKFIYPGIHFLF